MNQNPEQIARDKIDQKLVDAGWLVQSKDEVNLSAGKGVALRETNTESGYADYILFVNSKAVGVIEAKAEDLGFKLLQVEEQSVRYSKDAIKIGKFTLESEKPFVYESTGTVTRFTDYRDPKPRGRNVFSFHKPSTIEGWIKKGISLRERLTQCNFSTTSFLVSIPKPLLIETIDILNCQFSKTTDIHKRQL